MELNIYRHRKNMTKCYEITLNDEYDSKSETFNNNFSEITGYGSCKRESMFDFIRKYKYLLDKYQDFYDKNLKHFETKTHIPYTEGLEFTRYINKNDMTIVQALYYLSLYKNAKIRHKTFSQNSYLESNNYLRILYKVDEGKDKYVYDDWISNIHDNIRNNIENFNTGWQAYTEDNMILEKNKDILTDVGSYQDFYMCIAKIDEDNATYDQAYTMMYLFDKDIWIEHKLLGNRYLYMSDTQIIAGKIIPIEDKTTDPSIYHYWYDTGDLCWFDKDNWDKIKTKHYPNVDDNFNNWKITRPRVQSIKVI